MKRRLDWWSGLACIVLTSCAAPGSHRSDVEGLTTISVGGTTGAPVSGYYIQDGYHVPFIGTLPLTVARQGLTEFEVVKGHADDPIDLAAQTDREVWHWEVNSRANESITGLRVRFEDGLWVEKLAR